MGFIQAVQQAIKTSGAESILKEWWDVAPIHQHIYHGNMCIYVYIYIYIKRLKQVQWMLFFFLNHLSFARSSRRYSNNTWQTLEAVRCRTWCSSKNKSAVDILPSSTAVLLPSGKLTVRTWNTGVGSDDFPFGKPYFQGRTVSFREGS